MYVTHCYYSRLDINQRAILLAYVHSIALGLTLSFRTFPFRRIECICAGGRIGNVTLTRIGSHLSSATDA